MIKYGNKTFERTNKAFSTSNLKKDNACATGIATLIDYARNTFSRDNLMNFALNGVDNTDFCKYFLAEGHKYVDWMINNGYLKDIKPKVVASVPLGLTFDLTRTNGEYVLARMKVGYNKYAWGAINVETGKCKVDPTVYTPHDTVAITMDQFKTILGKDAGDADDIIAHVGE